jgi:hypothetical protein
MPGLSLDTTRRQRSEMMGERRSPIMSTSADGSHEFVVPRELAEVAERLGVPLHTGDRVRFEVIEGGRSEAAPRQRRLSWLGSVSSGEHTLSERAKADIRDGMGRQAD